MWPSEQTELGSNFTYGTYQLCYFGRSDLTILSLFPYQLNGCTNNYQRWLSYVLRMIKINFLEFSQYGLNSTNSVEYKLTIFIISLIFFIYVIYFIALPHDRTRWLILKKHTKNGKQLCQVHFSNWNDLERTLCLLGRKEFNTRYLDTYIIFGRAKEEIHLCILC